MASNNVQEDILERLDRIKNSRSRARYMTPDDYKQFMPETLGFKRDDDSLRFKRLDQINEKGIDATYLNAIKQANKRARLQAIAQRKRLAQEKKRYQQAKRDYRKPTLAPIPEPNFPAPQGYPQGFKAGVGQYLTTVSAGGHSFTVNRYVAPRFVGFVNALVAQGYKPLSIGGYANRNQANGSGLKSLHAYGLAIDIDPARNPYIRNPVGGRHALPRNVGALAAKYGLSWGGNWRNTKDYMHFSVPYGGRE